MRFTLKLILPGTALILLLFNACNTGTGLKEKSAESNDSHRSVNVTTTQTAGDRSDDPVVKFEAMVREMRNNNPPPDPDEIRRQRNVARAANMDWIKESTIKYSPDSWDLLMKYDRLPSSTVARANDTSVISTQKTLETFQYLRGRTRLDLLASMETNVHEIAHAYFDQNSIRYILDNNLTMDWNDVHGYIYVSPSEGFFLDFPLKSLFPSKELVKVIPGNMKTFRFDTYINGSTSTQSEGVIGLLNELYAYYTGSKYCYEMLEPFKTAAGSDANGLFEWASRTQSTMSAFYEFVYFISEYLLYMKEVYPENYRKLKSYKPFTDAYNTIYNLYKDLIDKYQQRIRDEIRLISSSGDATAKTEKGWLWIKPENSNISSGTPIFSEESGKLIDILGSRRYREIESDYNIN